MVELRPREGKGDTSGHDLGQEQSLEPAPATSHGLWSQDAFLFMAGPPHPTAHPVAPGLSQSY